MHACELGHAMASVRDLTKEYEGVSTSERSQALLSEKMNYGGCVGIEYEVCMRKVLVCMRSSREVTLRT